MFLTYESFVEIDNIFYVIWLDPLHNMYPDDKYGGLRKVKPHSTCCKDRDEEIIQLKQENEKLLNENKRLIEDLDMQHSQVNGHVF